MSEKATFPLRLPKSVKAEVERLAREEGISVNQFVATAVAEKLAVMRSAEFFAARRTRADFAAFDRIMNRTGGELPREGDEVDLASEPSSALSRSRRSKSTDKTS